MGARPSSFKKGGGFLDGVDATITGYQFTDEFNGEPFKPGKIKGQDGTIMDRPHSLNFLFKVRVEGAEEDTQTTLKGASNFDDYEVSEDGLTITAADGGPCSIGSNSALGKLIGSLCDAGFPDSLLSDDEDQVNFEPIIGTRVRLVQRTDVERTKKFGQKINKTNGKGYDRKDLIVAEVYDFPKAGSAPKGGTANANKPAKGKKAAAPVEEDIQDLSTRAIQEILERAGGKIAKAKLSVSTLTTPLLKGNAQRDDVRTWLVDDANLQTLVEAGVIEYNKGKQVISVAAE